MGEAPELRERLDLPDEVYQAGLNGNLVIFVGAGVSRLLDLPSWSGLAAKALEDLRQDGYLNYSGIKQLSDLDPKKQLSIARSIADGNGIKLDLTKHLSGKQLQIQLIGHMKKKSFPQNY